MQRLPGSGPERELLREKGQFWTPQWVAQAMVSYAVSNGASCLFDPAVGAGAFFLAAKALQPSLRREITCFGRDIDPRVIEQAKAAGLSEGDLQHLELRDFVLDPPELKFSSIVANPPYIRHHRLSEFVKQRLRYFGMSLIGKPLDGRAGYHIYFLLRALEILEEGGRLAFIMPADTVEGVSGLPLWRWITAHYRLDSVVTFSPDASPFPGVDTNPLIFFLSNRPPSATFRWARWKQAGGNEFTNWIMNGFPNSDNEIYYAVDRDVSEGVETGLSRPKTSGLDTEFTLSDFASVIRGIVTGDNDFFFLTRQQFEAARIPEEFVKPAVGRTRDVTDEVITSETLTRLEDSGRPTFLLSLDGRKMAAFPEAVQRYLRDGEQRNINEKPLISFRRPWYKMETRAAPPFLFAYLGRRNCRFVRNIVGALPLTCFLCVYPHDDSPEFVERLWSVLRHPNTVANLARVGKSYGSGSVKVEPRALERLPLPSALVAQSCLVTRPRTVPMLF